MIGIKLAADISFDDQAEELGGHQGHLTQSVLYAYKCMLDSKPRSAGHMISWPMGQRNGGIHTNRVLALGNGVRCT